MDDNTDEILRELPSLRRILIEKPGWLDQAVNTREAAEITGVPSATLISLRSKGGGPKWVKPRHTRIVRYFRRHLFQWLLSNGLMTNTAQLYHEPTTDPDG